MQLIRKNYEKRTAALTAIWFTVLFAYRQNGDQFYPMLAIFILGWLLSLIVLNKPKKDE
ncbi:hypothetical protein KKG83_01080 [Candidatus Micrarchaeota archaeon]|jgi:cyanate permease|nr:hypothetical protein [Candidatus Micrarchaeota archaeon]MBU2476042.1 hypothetical protein [Candidatus Micrarchaeota archaeon]